MYTTTFYSFKGGVGRSMALVNAGVELARRKRRVLLVDFDLAAPGLDTFKALESIEPSLGIVDFVNSYLESGKSDDVNKYVSRCHTEDESEELWLMPVGGSKSQYADQFHHIDWMDLYSSKDGFLLLEDLKQQWKDWVQPDYVLIDSPSGHTDVGSICTRQVPDAVAIFYFPNAQNLRGVSRAVKEIRSERTNSEENEIQLHFIMSNVPDLDDEHQTLGRQLRAFKTELGLREEPLVVHHNDSLSLLSQAVFTKDRPNSRLTSEYKEIVDQIVCRKAMH
ncbi:MAG: AAA family ATPase [Gammaproteobacteria bacterium]|nr:AAA family ATPase [Gammaproteobacteria bacterium]MYD80949.1 AAA family ATPase [Gammaproteobacteria bacterium]